MKQKTKRAFGLKVEGANKIGKETIENAKIFMADKAENISKKKNEAMEAAGARAEEVKKNMAESKAQFVEKAETIK